MQNNLANTPQEQLAQFMETLNRVAQMLSDAVPKADDAPVALPQPPASQPIAFTGGRIVSMAQMRDNIDMGPLATLLEDDSVNDILVNGPDSIYVERNGKIEKTDVAFPDHASLEALGHAIVHTVGRKLDPKRPLVDARLLDGSRVNIIAPPLAIDGMSISIRKFAKTRITLDKMLESGSLTKQAATLLAACAKARMNMVISGGAGAGKTTLLNAISSHIGLGERVVTIEDSAELQLQQPHVVRLETRESNPSRPDRADEVSIRDLVRNALRMRPDRIIIGEVRGREAFDMIQAMNTGHDGSLTTVHANTTRDALARIENMVLMANLNLPLVAIRRQLSSALHFIVQLSRMSDGTRRITAISEIVGIEGDMITMQDMFRFQQQSVTPDGKIVGTLQWTGVYPRNTKLATLLKETGALNS